MKEIHPVAWVILCLFGAFAISTVIVCWIKKTAPHILDEDDGCENTIQRPD